MPGLEELETEVLDDGRPEPLRIARGAPHQIAIVGETEAPHEPDDVRALEDAGVGLPDHLHDGESLHGRERSDPWMRARILAPEFRKWWTLGAVAFGLFMIMLDNTIVNVALPAMQRDLDIGLSELEWVVNGYALTFAVLMLTGGKLADLLGRRLIFIVGLAIFTGASLACGLAPNASVLIGARVVQGVGSALMNPATLSIITATFPPRQRGMAIGIWAGVAALALAIGPLVGGLITEHISWNWIFFINIPVGVFAILVTRLVVDESRDTSAVQRLDLPGLLASAIGLFALTYALIEANTYGWTSGRIAGLFAVAVVGLA